MNSGEETFGRSKGQRAALAVVAGVLLVILSLRLRAVLGSGGVLTLAGVSLATVALLWWAFRLTRSRAARAVARVVASGATAAWPVADAFDTSAYRVLAADADGVHLWRPRRRELVLERSLAWDGVEVTAVRVSLQALTWNGVTVARPRPDGGAQELIVVAPNPRMRMIRGATPGERDEVVQRLRDLAAATRAPGGSAG